MRQQFSNQEILEYATSLHENFLENSKDITLPIKINFYLQKNMKNFIEAAKEVEASRLKIGEKYGVYNPKDSSYLIQDEDKLKLAQKELQELMSLDQIIEVYPISLEDLQNVDLTVAQMNAMLFMIEE